MNTEALALELRNEIHTFLNELIDEFGTEGTISHDTFNKAINMRSNIIADSDLWDGDPVADTESKCNKHIVINWAFFPEEKPNYGDEILVEYPPEQMTKKEVLIYGRYTDLIDGCKWALITPCL